jgi:hypothetical protein
MSLTQPIPMSLEDNPHATAMKCLKIKRIPPEIIAIILKFLYRPMFNTVINEITGRYGMESIWWNPSDNLLNLCRDVGTIQIKNYDKWGLFPHYILYKEFANGRYDEDDDEDMVEEGTEEMWEMVTCGRRHTILPWGQVVGICRNCVAYNFPCINLARETSDKLLEKWSLLEDPACRPVVDSLREGGFFD